MTLAATVIVANVVLACFKTVDYFIETLRGDEMWEAWL